jgi:adenosine deaminase
VVIAMRQHGPHIAKILARQAISEAEHLHHRSGVVGFDIAGPERGNPPTLFRQAFDIARAGRIGATVHAGEDAGPEYIWQAIDDLGATRIGHGCSAVTDQALLKRLAKDKILVECCPTSNYQTGAVSRGEPHPLLTFLEHGVPVAICTDNTTVSRTDQSRETAMVASWLGRGARKTIRGIHRDAARHSYIAEAANRSK